MERRFAVRYEQLMAEAEVKPAALEGVLKRLDEFVKPFAASLKHDAQRQHAAEYVAGLVSNEQCVRYRAEHRRILVGPNEGRWRTGGRRGNQRQHNAGGAESRAKALQCPNSIRQTLPQLPRGRHRPWSLRRTPPASSER